MSLESAVRLLKVLDRLRMEAPDLPTQQLHVFLAVALDEGASMVTIQKRCRLSHAAGNRNVRALLTPDDEEEQAGKLCWLTDAQNPRNLRERLLFLSPKGRDLLANILVPLED